MARVRFDVDVVAGHDVVCARFDEAAADPQMIVAWFTADDQVEAEVRKLEPARWELLVVGPRFRAGGHATVRPRPPHARRSSESCIGVDARLHPRGLLGLAGPLLNLAGGRIESHARTTLWREFGKPS